MSMPPERPQARVHERQIQRAYLRARLWQRVFAEVRREYSEIESRHLYIDTLAMEMVRDPSQFDVIVTCNLFGDIISDLGAQLAGGSAWRLRGTSIPKALRCSSGARFGAQYRGEGNRQPDGVVLAVR